MARQPTENESGLSTRTHVLLLSSTFFFIFLGTGAQQAFLLPYLQDLTDWSKLQRVLVLATVYFSMAVFRLGNVYLLRNWPQWMFSLVGGATYVLFPLAVLLVSFFPSYPLAIGAAALWGWGGAAMWMGTTMQILALADRAQRHGTGMGVLYGATLAGWAVGVIVLGNIFGAARAIGRPWLLYVAAFAFAAIGHGIMLRLPRPPEPLPEMPTWGSLVEIMSRAKARIAAFLLFASALAFGFFLGSFTEHVENVSGGNWAWIAIFFYPFARFVLSFTSGLLSERFSHGSILAAGFFGGAAGLGIPLLVDHPLALAATALTMGLLNGAVPVVSTALIGTSAEQKRRPLTYGAMFTWRDLGAVIAMVAGKILEVRAESVTATFGVFAVVFALCGIVSLILNRYAEQRL
ncbi:MAG: MFS transporter [Armatimonadota bacterium]|nr:MFS transporter [Armatimonadota bacterium]